MVTLGNDWDALLAAEFQKDYYLALRQFLKREYRTGTVYPDMYDIFNALKATSYGDARVVLLGQDPYHGPGQAHGMCFSVRPGVDKPPSLQNIFKELESDLGVAPPPGGNLEGWARQGVLLLNTVLTVRAGQPGSHKGKGWEILTDEIIALLGRRPEPLVFLLWGAYARSKKKLIGGQHLVVESVHPSPLSAYNGFFGSRPFSRANAFLTENGLAPIDWARTQGD